MYAMDALREVAKRTNKSFTRIGLEIGSERSYMCNTERRHSSPQANTLAKMLATCGYVLCAVPNENMPEDALIID